MTRSELKEFLEEVYYGSELWFIWNRKGYFYQGWFKNEKYEFCLDQVRPDPKTTDYEWFGRDTDRNKLGDIFLNTPLFEGKTFLEIADEAIWTDDDFVYYKEGPMSLREFCEKYCLHDSYVESAKYLPDDKLLVMEIVLGSYIQENYDPSNPEQECVELIFQDCTYVKHLPSNIMGHSFFSNDIVDSGTIRFVMLDDAARDENGYPTDGCVYEMDVTADSVTAYKHLEP